MQKDEREGGLRKTLNLGHTTGHAFELYYKRKSHGEFVLIGMYYELYIAEKLGICATDYADSLRGLIAEVLSVPAYNDAEEACMGAVYDKKNVKSREISMVVPKDPGQPEEIRLGVDEYARLIAECAAKIKEQA